MIRDCGRMISVGGGALMAGERVLGALVKLTRTVTTLSIRPSAYLSACNKSALAGPVFVI
jgi:hypothetical protein